MTVNGPKDVLFYQTNDGGRTVQIRLEDESVWLTRHQLAELYGRDVKTIGKHIANARREELAGLPVVAKFATTASDGKTYNTEHFNLDVVLSVGYRVKSPEGIRFRQWSNHILLRSLSRKASTVAAANDGGLPELPAIVEVLSRSTDVHIAGVAEVLKGYLPGFTLLRDFDEGYIENTPNTLPGWELTIAEAREVIDRVSMSFPQDRLLGHERDGMLEGVIAAIYQQFGGLDLYQTVEEKAANLLYFVVKDHPLLDGNKRCAAALLVTFLNRNGLLLEKDGEPRITNSALAAITLLVAMSQSNEKDLMISLIIRMILGESA